jgi:hypothetical protein
MVTDQHYSMDIGTLASGQRGQSTVQVRMLLLNRDQIQRALDVLLRGRRKLQSEPVNRATMHLPGAIELRQLPIRDSKYPTDRFALVVAPKLRSAFKGDREGLGR